MECLKKLLHAYISFMLLSSGDALFNKACQLPTLVAYTEIQNH